MSFKIKDFIVPAFLALGFTFLFQYFFVERGPGNRSDQIVSGRSVVAPSEAQRPLNREVDFKDSAVEEPKVTLVETDYGKATFSSLAGSLQKFEFKHQVGGDWLTTIDAQGNEDRCFLLGFEEKTPLNYELESFTDSIDTATLIYKAQFDGGNIIKKITVFKRICKIDLNIVIEPINLNNPIRLRLFYPAPFVKCVKDDQGRGVFDEGAPNNIKISSTGLLERYWESPSLFGVDDQYFLNTMYKDENSFAQRGYYKKYDDRLIAILESREIKDKSNFLISFYFGPKKLSNFSSVDMRLEKTLEYGLTSPFSKLILKILNFFYLYLKNYGWAIILFTLLLKLLLLPFTLKGEEANKKQVELRKKMQYLQQKYKHDQKALGQARAELIKKHGMPGMGGCLPLLLQFPVFWGLNKIILKSIDLFQAPFIWVPNLAAPDPYFILPVLVSASIITHSLSTATDARQRMTAVGMGLIFGALSVNFPSGVVIFIFVSTALGVLQNQIYNFFKKA